MDHLRLDDRLYVESEIRNLHRRNQYQEAMNLAFSCIELNQFECLIEIDGKNYPLRKEDGIDSTWPKITKERTLIEPFRIPLIWDVRKAFFVGLDFTLHAYQTLEERRGLASQNSSKHFINHLKECKLQNVEYQKNLDPDFPSDDDDDLVLLYINTKRLMDIFNYMDTDIEWLDESGMLRNILENIFIALAKNKTNLKRKNVSYQRPGSIPRRTFVFDEVLQKEMEWQKKTLLKYYLNQDSTLGI